MKRVCLKCQRIFTDGNLFCQESYCPGEQSPMVFDKGQMLDEVEIIKPLVVLRSCVLYDAIHIKQPVLLKLAHPGKPYTSRLIDEVKFLESLNATEIAYYNLPHLKAPYGSTRGQQTKIAQTVYQNNLFYYCVYQYFDGEPLPHLTAKNPQLWVNQVGWLMLTLTQSLNFLHSKNRLHLVLNPSSILVRLDKAYPHVPRILLHDLGLLIDSNSVKSPDSFAAIAMPAYTSPELLRADGPTRFDDVYSVGAILHELLNGYPMIAYKIRDDVPVRQDVINHKHTPMTRIDIDSEITQITEQSLSPRELRLDLDKLIKTLHAKFSPLPKEKQSNWISQETVYMLIWAILSIAFLIVIALSLFPEPQA